MPAVNYCSHYGVVFFLLCFLQELSQSLKHPKMLFQGKLKSDVYFLITEENISRVHFSTFVTNFSLWGAQPFSV